jgi:hypothetical protein
MDLTPVPFDWILNQGGEGEEGLELSDEDALNLVSVKDAGQ